MPPPCPLFPTDVFLIVPQRKAPSEQLVAAVTSARGGGAGHGGEEDDDDDVLTLPANAAAWERAFVAMLRRGVGGSSPSQSRRRCPDWLLAAVVFVRPWRLVAGLLYLAVWILLARLHLAPVFTLLTIVATIFLNLGTRGAGEASAYSVFNAGVQRLPGQLDAD